MIVKSPEPKKRKIDDYEIHLEGGIILPLNLDFEAGDSVDWEHSPTAIRVKLASKPSVTDVGINTLEEDLTIMLSKVLFIQHRQREVTDLTVEQQLEWSKTIQELSKTVQ
jgi:hypothetical protein